MNSRMFKISQKPVLLKSKKFLLEADWDEKQQCCQTIRATRPRASSMKTGMYAKVLGHSDKNLLA